MISGTPAWPEGSLVLTEIICAFNKVQKSVLQNISEDFTKTAANSYASVVVAVHCITRLE